MNASMADRSWGDDAGRDNSAPATARSGLTMSGNPHWRPVHIIGHCAAPFNKALHLCTAKAVTPASTGAASKGVYGERHMLSPTRDSSWCTRAVRSHKGGGTYSTTGQGNNRGTRALHSSSDGTTRHELQTHIHKRNVHARASCLSEGASKDVDCLEGAPNTAPSATVKMSKEGAALDTTAPKNAASERP